MEVGKDDMAIKIAVSCKRREGLVVENVRVWGVGLEAPKISKYSTLE